MQVQGYFQKRSFHEILGQPNTRAYMLILIGRIMIMITRGWFISDFFNILKLSILIPFLCKCKKKKQVTLKGHVVYYVDGQNTAESNWLRYINCARDCKEQNVEFSYCKGRVYYRTIRDIQPREEFLVYYGDDYAQYLNIDIQNYDCPCGGECHDEEEQNIEIEKEIVQEILEKSNY